MACGAQMILMNVVRDDTMAVAGFEHHTYMCSDCKDVERRLVFARPAEDADPQPIPAHTVPAAAAPMHAAPLQAAPAHAVPMHAAPADAVPIYAAPPIAPAVIEQNSRSGGLLRRVLGRLRGE
jgi:hypothetical protein